MVKNRLPCGVYLLIDCDDVFEHDGVRYYLLARL
jgi:hypothetical protein